MPMDEHFGGAQDRGVWVCVGVCVGFLSAHFTRFQDIKGQGAFKPGKEKTLIFLRKTSVFDHLKWSGRLDLNQRLLGPEPSALPG